MVDEFLRNQIAEALEQEWNPEHDPALTASFGDYAATALRALGMFIVTTAAELDDLPPGTVIRSITHGVVLVKSLYPFDGLYEWRVDGGWALSSTANMVEVAYVPALVLWRLPDVA